MANEYILAIDQGTTGSTVLIVNWKERQIPKIIGKSKVDFKQYYPHPDWVAHDLDEIWESICKASDQAMAQAFEYDKNFSKSKIIACGITNQRETICVFDRKTSRPLTHAIVWQCKRSNEICLDLKKRGLEEIIRQKTGLLCDPYFSGTKIAWLMENDKRVANALASGEALLGTIDTFLIHKMTKASVHATEPSNASRTLLYNIDKGDWDEELGEICRLPNLTCLPEVKDSATIFGKTQGVPFLVDGTPISGVLGDQQAALAGQGCVKTGMAKCTYGTGAFLLLNVGNLSPRSQHGLLTTVAWQLKNQLTYAMEGSAFIAGAAVQFLRDQLGIISTSVQSYELAKDVTAAPDIYFVPALSGLGAPYWQPTVKGGILGLTRASSAKQIVRACLEGIAFQVGDLLEAMASESKSKLAGLRVDGGASANDLLCEIQANVADTIVERPTILDTTAFGAALFAGIGIGQLSGLENFENIQVIDKRFQPASSADERIKRQKMWNGWKRAVSAVSVFAQVHE